MPPRDRDQGKSSRPADDSPPNSAEREESGTEYLNVTNGPITYSKDGRQVGGGEWIGPVNLDGIGQAARRNGYLMPRSAL